MRILGDLFLERDHGGLFLRGPGFSQLSVEFAQFTLQGLLDWRFQEFR